MIHKMMEGTASSSGKAGHKILAPDMPVELRRAQKALNALPESDQQIVRVKLMPYIIDDREATEAERARFVGRGIRPFQQRYIQILGKLNRIMKEINATD
jgi:hypothetical protein